MEVIVVCLKYNTSFINGVSLILSIIIVFGASFGINNIKHNIISNKDIENNEITSKEITNGQSKNSITEKNKQQNIEEENDKVIERNINDNLSQKMDEFDWYIEIPKIKLQAPIEEGTDDEVLNRSVGHFKDTSRKNGNCGLAAHNRGYKVNYFAKLKELEKDDIIYYFVDNQKFQYKVTESVIIYETDWSMLEDTEENMITLITCVENRDEYRLCVQGVLIDE